MPFELLQIPHSKEDVQEVLRTFEQQLSREAKSKLTLDAFVPPPSDVDNERYEPLFDKYIITGKTYTTASGAVVPNELQYYNGQMVHLYGECSNVPLVNAALAGSGYRPITLKYADGRHAAVAQLWSNKFTDTSIRPYAAMFIVVAAVADNAPESQASLRAASNGASSVLVMLDGSFDPATAVYENEARMYMFRLLDTTQVAIDVGRERMGTDKRPGTIDMACNGRRLHLSIKDQHRRGVVQGDLELTGDPTAYGSVVAQAAKTAGITLQALPRGTECVYPAVARIGQGPVVCWQWRSDVAPRLQPVMPGSLLFDRSSEEGRTLLAWGFTPKVLGFFPKVRGVITGLADQTPRYARDSSAACAGNGERRLAPSFEGIRRGRLCSIPLGLEYELPRIIEGGAPQRIGRPNVRRPPGQLAHHGRDLRWAGSRCSRVTRRGGLDAYPPGWNCDRQRPGVFRDAGTCSRVRRLRRGRRFWSRRLRSGAARRV